MPEGPEVKIVSDFINSKLHNKNIISIDCISSPYKQKYSEITKEVNKFLPLKFNSSFCRGKTTFIKLIENKFLAYHLGMTGFWSLDKRKHAHLQIVTKSSTLYFHDTRRFGNIKLVDRKLLDTKYDINLDLLNNTISVNKQAEFIISLINTNREVCKVLLDQRYFLGVGNYLKSEILFKSNIHPNTRWNKLTFKEKLSICHNTKEEMIKSYHHGGAQLRDFKNPNISSSLKLNVYNKKTVEGKKIIKKITSDNRISYWCPEEQKVKN